MRIVASTPESAALLRLLKRHPRVDVADDGVPQEGLSFAHGGRVRRVIAGYPTCEASGLPELMDNNPIVCSDTVCVPTPSATLGMIALGPIARAGLIVEPPAVMLSTHDDDRNLKAYLAQSGWSDGITLDCQPQELGGVLEMTAMALIQNPDEWSDVDDLYNECFGRSFFVRRDEESPWHANLVLGDPYALYRLRYTLGKGQSLLTIRVMADLDGKCGAAQIVHTMNIMVGFEETLGIV